MDRGNNPFSPGAGSRPPELAGRQNILDDVLVALKRVKNGRAEKSMMWVGLRGVGKTVLLVEAQRIAENEGYKVAFIEAHESRRKKSLPELLIPELRKLLFDLDRGEQISQKAKRAMRVLKSFVNSLRLKISDIELYINTDPEEGEADSGDIEIDLPALFVAIGEAAKDKATAVAIIIDEMQYLEENDLSALIMSIHKISQKSLPLILIGAGLPQLRGKAGDSKSYAERLFNYPEVGALNFDDAKIALQAPLTKLGVCFEEEALEKIYELSQGYPYFIQEWGYQSWNLAVGPNIITADDIEKATETVISKLDESFFRVRFDRLTQTEKKYVRALAGMGNGPQRSGDIAIKLGKKTDQVAPLRAQLINKGMIYSPTYGETAFTVPLFEEFLLREIPDDSI